MELVAAGLWFLNGYDGQDAGDAGGEVAAGLWFLNGYNCHAAATG